MGLSRHPEDEDAVKQNLDMARAYAHVLETYGLAVMAET